MSAKVPCRRTLGHGEACNEERMCAHCAELMWWRGIGAGLIDQINDWSTGHISRSAFISHQLEQRIKGLL